MKVSVKPLIVVRDPKALDGNFQRIFKNDHHERKNSVNETDECTHNLQST